MHAWRHVALAAACFNYELPFTSSGGSAELDRYVGQARGKERGGGVLDEEEEQGKKLGRDGASE
jgi:hypothetical protein